MSRPKALAASAAFALVLALGSASSAAAGAGALAPRDAGGAQPQVVWTWICQAFGGCK